MRAGIIPITGVLVILSMTTFAQDHRKASGVVVDADTDQAVAKATVRYTDYTGTIEITQTDSKGNFEFTSGTRGVIKVTAGLYGTARRSWPPRRSSTLLRFELTSPATAGGTLVDAVTQRPVEGIVTLVVRHPLNHVSIAARAHGGKFAFSDLPDGPAILYARADGFAPYLGSLTLKSRRHRDAQVNLLLEARVSGHVLDGNGDPVVGARVRIGYDRATIPGSGILAGLVRGQTLTGSDGAFMVGGLLPDTPIALQAELDEQQSDVVTVTVEPGMMQPGITLRI